MDEQKIMLDLFNKIQNEQLKQLQQEMKKTPKDGKMLQSMKLDELIGGNLEYFDALVNEYISNPDMAKLGLMKTIYD
jgi:muramoyltetrapeptide carboxypeptidase LdcA involved in peptidoglycan recycling